MSWPTLANTGTSRSATKRLRGRSSASQEKLERYSIPRILLNGCAHLSQLDCTYLRLFDSAPIAGDLSRALDRASKYGTHRQLYLRRRRAPRELHRALDQLQELAREPDEPLVGLAARRGPFLVGDNVACCLARVLELPELVVVVALGAEGESAEHTVV